MLHPERNPVSATSALLKSVNEQSTDVIQGVFNVADVEGVQTTGVVILVGRRRRRRVVHRRLHVGRQRRGTVELIVLQHRDRGDRFVSRRSWPVFGPFLFSLQRRRPLKAGRR